MFEVNIKNMIEEGSRAAASQNSFSLWLGLYGSVWLLTSDYGLVTSLNSDMWHMTSP